MLFALGFIGLFTMGGLTGLLLAALGVDMHVHDTYFIIAHFHFIMVGGTVMAYMAGLHFWWPKMTGRMYPEWLGRLAALIIFVGFILTFLPQFVLGYLGMPRRYHVYPPGVPGAQRHVVGRRVDPGRRLPAAVDLPDLVARTAASRPGPIPWGATGLEWQTPSPPPPHNFDETPIVTLRTLRVFPGGDRSCRLTTPSWPITSTTSSSSTRPRRWACGCSWRRRS